MSHLHYNYTKQQGLLDEKCYCLNVMQKPRFGSAQDCEQFVGYDGQTTMEEILNLTKFWPKNAMIVFYVHLEIFTKHQERSHIKHAIEQALDIHKKFPDRTNYFFIFSFNRYFEPGQCPTSMKISPSTLHGIRLSQLRITNIYSSCGNYNVTTTTINYKDDL